MATLVLRRLAVFKATRRRAAWGAIALWFAFLLVVYFIVLPVRTVLGQEHHQAGHDVYKSWTNLEDKNCCHDRDCGQLADERLKETKLGTFVRVDNEWCEVKLKHYLQRGANSPNWSTAHVCIRPSYHNESTGQEKEHPCERLLCYQPKPMH